MGKPGQNTGNSRTVMGKKQEKTQDRTVMGKTGPNTKYQELSWVSIKLSNSSLLISKTKMQLTSP